MKQIIACITCDVEVKSTNNIGQLEEIVALLDKYGINSTFFIEITQENVDLYSDSKILSTLNNHELGLHIHWGVERDLESYTKGLENIGSYTKGLDNISLEIMQRELEDALELSKELGFTPVSFRGGGLCCTNTSLKLIKDYGFKVDSSVAAKLNEKEGWFQGHTNAPYSSWYYPSKQAYDLPALDYDERQGILEVPVTRMIPSGREWSPWTLSIANPLFKFIVYERIIKSRWEPITVITPIFHSWGWRIAREEKFSWFMEKLEKTIRFMISKKLIFMSLIDLHKLLESAIKP